MARLLSAVLFLSLAFPCEAAFQFGLGKAVAKRSAEVIDKVNPLASLSPCGSGPFFTVSPVALSDVNGIVPLGNLSPTGHVFPSDHVYFYMKQTNSSYPIYFPGDAVITELASSETSSVTDYTIRFSVCKDFKSYFFHVKSLSAALLSQMEAVEAKCQTYTTGGATYRRCSRFVNIKMKAGEQFGTVSGNFGAFDFGAYDARITPLAFVNSSRHYSDQLYTVCPFDYYSDDIKQQFQAKIGSHDGAIQRTIAPVCGTIMYDVSGTAQGDWYKTGAPDSPEDPHLALVYYNVNPSWQAISIGSSLSGFSGVFHFAPNSSGLTNRDFRQVTADGNTYCYDCFFDIGNPNNPCTTRGYILLMQMTSPTTLRIEKQTTSGCGGGPWSFTSPVEFQR